MWSSVQYSVINLSARSVSSFEPGLLVGDVDPKPPTSVVGVVGDGVGILDFVVEGVGVVILDPPVLPHLLALVIGSFSQVPSVTSWVTPRMSRMGKLLEENGGGGVGGCWACWSDRLVLLRRRASWEVLWWRVCLPNEVFVGGDVVDEFLSIGTECPDDCPVIVDLSFGLLEGPEWSLVGCHGEELGGVSPKYVREDPFGPEVVEGSAAEPPGVKEFVGGANVIFVRVWSISSNVPANVRMASSRLARSAKRESIERVTGGRAVVGGVGAWCSRDVARLPRWHRRLEQGILTIDLDG